MYMHHIGLHNIQGGDFVQDQVSGRADFTFLFIKSPTTFLINKQIHAIATPSVILIDSYVPHKYFPTGTVYIDDYLNFAVTDRSTFLAELTFPLNIPITVSKDSSINQVLQHLAGENKDSKYWAKAVEMMINLLMIRIAEQWDLLQQENSAIPHYDDLVAVRSRIRNTPEKIWSVDELAGLAHLSQAYFQVMYKKAFGVTCITEVIRTKISRAKELLISTNLTVKGISQELGYSDVYHFIRQFKKSTGMTPGSFRKKLAEPEL